MRIHVSSTRRRAVAAAAVGTLALGGLAAISAAPAGAAVACSVQYQSSDWPGGMSVNITLRNTGDAWTSWVLAFSFADANQKVSQGWSATWAQSGRNVTATSLSWNGAVASGGSTSIGFNGAWSGSDPAPTVFSINGVTCGVPTSATSTSSTSATTTSGPTVTSTSTSTATATRTTTTTTGSVGPHLDNPYVGAKWYVNPDWAARANAEAGGSRISNQPTAVWLDSINSITAPAGSGYTTGLAAHLDNALAQGATLAQFVIYDLPGRDCAALASNGELGPTEIARYETEYIDPITAIEANPKYASIRIVNIVEIDSLPNLVTNTGTIAACATMAANGNYVTGIAYALSKLHAAGGNVYNYIDAAHHGWLGWSSNFVPAATLFASTAQKATGGVATVDGFIVNTANYGALSEPYVTIGATVGGVSVRQSAWVDWNDYTDELTYTQAFRTQLVSSGFNSNIGMLIDTSRNGWGGAARPTAASTSTDLNTWVNASKIDRRIHPGNWCNQSGAGLGERPKAAPATGIDAYVWIKPPGESDGSSTLIPTGPSNPAGKGLDRMCDPTYTGNSLNGNNMSGALANAPVSGAWFSAQFQQLLANAYPAL